MRIWLVPVIELCDRRVLGQHSEWHAIEVLIRRDGKRWLHWHEPRHLRAFYRVHATVCLEMQQRGWTGHASPPLYRGDGEVPTGTEGNADVEYPVSEADLFLNRSQLFARWGGAFRGRQMGEGSEWMWTVIEQAYLLDPHRYDLDYRSAV